MGCGESKEALEPSVTPKATPEKETKNPDLPKAEVKKPLTKEESAEVIEKAIRKELKKPTGELTEADLEKVAMLYLGNNKLTEVPKTLEKLTQLRELHLSFNRLTDVKGLEKLTKLEELNLQGNQLTSVKGLEKLAQLEYLNLNFNQWTDLKELEKFTQLELLRLDDNPDLTKAQITELQKALPKCEILSNPTK